MGFLICNRRNRPQQAGLTSLALLAAACLGLVSGCESSSSTEATPSHPFSPIITGIDFDLATLQSEAPGSDNWPLTWGADDHQYTSWGDGGGFGGTNTDGRVSMGVGRIEGPYPTYSTSNVWGGKDAANPAQFEGKSYGILSVEGTLYLWRTGNGSDDSAFRHQQLFRSRDNGAHWEPTGVGFSPADFPDRRGFFAPTFLQFGRDYAGARDGYVYIYAPEISAFEWDVQYPGKLTLMRVPANKIHDRSRYEFFAGMDTTGKPQWSDDVGKRRAVFEDAANGVMRTSASYNAGLGRYLLITQQVSRLKERNGHIGIYDAPEPWGPWTTVLFANPWDLDIHTGSKTVFWNFSNKWLSADGKQFVMVYTGPGADEFGTLAGRFLTLTRQE